ncbi:MAG: hypothetical protein ACRDPZ_03385 [Gaiellaceae bacterium]
MIVWELDDPAWLDVPGGVLDAQEAGPDAGGVGDCGYRLPHGSHHHDRPH